MAAMNAATVQPAPSWPVMSLEQAEQLLTAPGTAFEVEETTIRGARMKVWKAAPPTLRDILLMGRNTYGSRTFLVFEDERCDFEAFSRAAIHLAHHLIERGVKKGDRLAILMSNLPEWPVAFFAGVLVGAIVTPLNGWWTGEELEYAFRDSGSKLAIMDKNRFERFSPHLANCPDLEQVIVTRAPGLQHPMASALEQVIGSTNAWASLGDLPLPDVPLEPEDDATIFYTSGTTGRPKGALGTHRGPCTSMYIAGYAGARNYLRRGEAPPTPGPHNPQRRALLSVPFFHVTGCFAVLCRSVWDGAMIALMRRFEPEAAMKLIEKERITAFGGVPTIAWQVIEHPARGRYDLSSVEQVSYGGAPAAAALVRRIKETWPSSEPGCGWGMTETSATFTSHSAQDYVHRPESCGPAPPVCQMKIVDPATGQALPTGEVGELWGKGPTNCKAYWNNPQATDETFVQGWVRTGDLARLDEEGFCYIVDRAKDMIIRGGENIYCAEVEAVLYQHPAVMDAALVGAPHPTLGEEPVAVVTLTRGAQLGEDVGEEEIKAFLRAKLAPFKIPVKVLFHAGTLPRNANGKILKNELKKQFVQAA
jgi:long-chain acyl-CoA synthetase